MADVETEVVDFVTKNMDTLYKHCISMTTLDNRKMAAFFDRYYQESWAKCRNTADELAKDKLVLAWIRKLACSVHDVIALRKAAIVAYTAPQDVLADAARKAYPSMYSYIKERQGDLLLDEMGIFLEDTRKAAGQIGAAYLIAEQLGIPFFLNLVDISMACMLISITAASSEDDGRYDPEIKSTAKFILEDNRHLSLLEGTSRLFTLLEHFGRPYNKTAKPLSEKELYPIIYAIDQEFMTDEDREHIRKSREEQNEAFKKGLEEYKSKIKTDKQFVVDAGKRISKDINQVEYDFLDRLPDVDRNAGYQTLSEWNDDFDDAFKEWMKLVMVGISTKRLANTCNDLLDEAVQMYDELEEREQDKENAKALRTTLSELTAANSKLERKQKLLNENQRKIDKLEEKLAAEKSRSKELSHQLDVIMEELQNVEANRSAETIVETDEPESFPEKTVLFGGHPNWVRKFAIRYPEVRIVDPDDKAFPLELVRHAGLVLINTTHMSHAQFARVIAAARENNISIRYIR